MADTVSLKGYKPGWFEFAREADIFVNLSDTEGFCIVVAEAMSVGLPVIATDVGGIVRVRPRWHQHAQAGRDHGRCRRRCDHAAGAGRNLTAGFRPGGPADMSINTPPIRLRPAWGAGAVPRAETLRSVHTGAPEPACNY